MTRRMDSVDKAAQSLGRALEPLPWLRQPLRAAWRPVIACGRAVEREWQQLRRRRQVKHHLGMLLERIGAIEAGVRRLEPRPREGTRAVVMMNVSSSPGSIGFNNLVGLLTSWTLRLGGQPVHHWLCRSGMAKCPQGRYRSDPAGEPPCEPCVQVRSRMFAESMREWFESRGGAGEQLPELGAETSLDELLDLRYKGIELGRVCLPALRHTLRRYHLEDDPGTRRILSDFVRSAVSVVDATEVMLRRVRPSAVVVFNGLLFPEAITRRLALEMGIPAVTYEVGFAPHSAFFSHEMAPEYPLEIPEEFSLGEQENAELDAYLEQRFGGDFTMGGIRFWDEMKGLDQGFVSRARQHQQVVSLFTNSVFDTSQVSANTIFGSMFDWLEQVLGLAAERPETLFVVRSHPDEFRTTRLGRRRQRSIELVGDWMEAKGLLEQKNIVLVPPTESLSSYELFKASKICLVYNSTVGLEAAMMGIPVVCGGKAKYSSLSFLPRFRHQDEYLRHVSCLLAEERRDFPGAWREEARRFFHYLFFQASLSLARFVEAAEDQPGSVMLRKFSAEALCPDRNEEMSAIFHGIVEGAGFCPRTPVAARGATGAMT